MNPDEYRTMWEMENAYWWFVARRRLVRALIARYVPADPSMQVHVDVGCGTGMMMLELDPKPALLAGLDVSPNALALTRSRVNLPLVSGDAVQLPFATGAADLVTCLDVLEHVRDDLGCLAECYRVCKPGGWAVFSVPALEFLWSEHDEALHHLRRYSKPALRARLVHAGFEPVKLTHAVCALCLPIFARSFFHALCHSGLRAHTMLQPVPPWLNRMLIALQDVENAVSMRVSLPLGTGLVCACRKPLEQP